MLIHILLQNQSSSTWYCIMKWWAQIIQPFITLYNSQYYRPTWRPYYCKQYTYSSTIILYFFFLPVWHSSTTLVLRHRGSQRLLIASQLCRAKSPQLMWMCVWVAGPTFHNSIRRYIYIYIRHSITVVGMVKGCTCKNTSDLSALQIKQWLRCIGHIYYVLPQSVCIFSVCATIDNIRWCMSRLCYDGGI